MKIKKRIIDMHKYYKTGAPVYIKVLLILSSVVFLFNAISSVWVIAPWYLISPIADCILGILLIVCTLVFKSPICSLIQLAYSLYGFIVLFTIMPMFLNWPYVVASVCALVATVQFQIHFKQYRKYYLSENESEEKTEQ